MGNDLSRLNFQSQRNGEDDIDHDIILVWAKEEKRVITGEDILGRLLKGT